MFRPVFFSVLLFLALAFSVPARGQSIFSAKPDDPRAVTLSKENFPVHADGIADDADALQQAIDQVGRSGVLFIPEGRYRLGKTVFVWAGIRLIGYGSNRPVFVLGARTPGFQEGRGHYMVHFADNRPFGNTPFSDASEFTFYSGMNNIDFEVAEGNPAAVCIRFHVAQHSTLTHMNFNLGTALAAMEDIGNQSSDVHVRGGQYGILSKKTSPNWQYLLMDSTFENQSVAAIHTQEVGFTLIRCRFSHMPVAIEIPPGEVEQLYARDLLLEDIRDIAIKFGDARNFRHQVTLENTTCAEVPHFLGAPEKIDAPGRFYTVDHLSSGLEIGDDGRELGVLTRHRESPLQQAAAPVPTDIPPLPPMEQWVSVRTLGAKADNSDDGPALQAAIEKNRILFFPAGNYRISAPLKLRPDTVLIGLHPATTILTLTGQTESPSGVIVAPRNGTNLVTGLGVTPGGPRAAGVLWLAGEKSMLEDVSFASRGGGGRGARGAAPTEPVAPDLLVTDGGGGIFRDLWAHATGSGAGLRAENTSTPARIYQLSNEHHAAVEVQFHNVQNWEIYCLQTEEENPAGANAIALEVQDSRHLLFADTYTYRVSRNVRPKTHAIHLRNSDDIVFNNMKVFSQTRLAFDNCLLNESTDTSVRARDFTHLAVTRSMKKPEPLPLPAVFAQGAKVEEIATGLSNATSLTADDNGRIYFTDAADHRIFRLNEAGKKAELIAELPGNQQPMVMRFVKPSTLLIVAYEKFIYSLELKEGAQPQQVSETASLLPNTTLLLPVGLHNSMTIMNDMMEHRGYVYRQGSNTAITSVVENEHRGYFYAPGTTTAIMAGGTGRPILQSCQLAPFTPGTQHYLTSEDDARTWLVTVDEDWKLTARLFADRGGNSVVTDSAGNVYIASSQVCIYDKQGKQIGILEIPQRPSSLLFAGPDKQTLYIAARGSLYAIRAAVAGE